MKESIFLSFFCRLVSGAKSGANFSLKAFSNSVKMVEIVILLPRLIKLKTHSLSGFLELIKKSFDYYSIINFLLTEASLDLISMI